MRKLASVAFLCVVVAAASTGAQRPAGLAPRSVVVVFDTDKGRIEIEVDVAHAPATAANFLRYVDGGLYNGGYFHRSVRPDNETRTDAPIQVIQASRADGRPGFPPIALERTSVTGLRHTDGTVSMARGQPDTAVSEFFVCIGDQPELDFGGKRRADGQGFAAFGHVIAGRDVVRAIQQAPVTPGTQNLATRVGIVRAARRR
jgi:peptidyl-prolyl cis-trans isomerase A (cyclophilin A)